MRYKLLLSALLISATAFAKEGMWLPPQLSLRETDMKATGLKIPVSQIYNEEGTGLNNAVVLFGRGCTGELISNQGLLLTNHHCGYGTVQGLASAGKDYFANGFWAMSNREELPCPGLTVTFVRKMENISDNILHDLPDTMATALRDTMIARRVRTLERHWKEVSKLDASIQPFYNGNQYWVILTETFRDIRLVGFPPNGIGSFGGDTDNWMWPRHNGDFSMFRIYANAGNQPADYNAANKPYKPKRFFTISTRGYKPGDFTMVYGFPGTTQEYISSSQLNQIQNISDPIRIAMRTKKLAIWRNRMNSDRDVFLKYTSKAAGVANAWKKWQGEVRGLKINDVLGKKEAAEQTFAAWASRDTTLPYADDLLARLTASYQNIDTPLLADEYIREGAMGIELIAQGALLNQWLKAARGNNYRKTLDDNIRPAFDGFLKNYEPSLDREVFLALMPEYMRISPRFVPQKFRTALAVHNGDYAAWASQVYKTSLLARPTVLRELMAMPFPDTNRIINDPAYQLWTALTQLRETEVAPALRRAQDRNVVLNRLYMKARMQQEPNRTFYSDASLTLRLAYGQVKGIDPDGPAGFSYQTTLDEAMLKDRPGDPEFDMPQALRDVYQRKDFGRWKVNGTVPVNFIADNHTTGGNSGSPVLNARGELIGTNFDRIWEGTMSDLYFDPNLSRNISVDIRYTLFVVEKIGKAGWLLKEMKLN